MITLLLIASLVAAPQEQTASGRIDADSAWVRDILEAAEEEIRALPAGARRGLTAQMGRMWASVGDFERGAALLRGAPRDESPGPWALEQDLYQPWISLTVAHFMAGDTASARQGETALEGEARDAYRGELAMHLLRSGRRGEADSVRALIVDPVLRGRALLEGTRIPNLSGLTEAEVVRSLREELPHTEGLSDHEAVNLRLYIHGRLLNLGVRLTPREVSVSLTPEQAQRNLRALAEYLDRTGRREEALPLWDSAWVIAEARSDLGPRASLGNRASVLEGRGSPGDSTQAALLRDAQARLRSHPYPAPPPQPEELRRRLEALRQARERSDLQGFEAHLASLDDAGFGIEAFREAVSMALVLSGRQPDPAARALGSPPSSELRSLLESAWSLGTALTPAARDSMRSSLVRPWIALGTEPALERALEIGTRRFRERAVSGFVRRIPTERAARLFDDFEDEEALNRAFSHLTMRYLDAGQVALAETAAVRTASGSARVWALARAGEARWNTNDTTRARALIRAALEASNDVTPCEGDCFIAAASPPTTPSSLLTPLIGIAYLAGETAALEVWARSRSDAKARAGAYIKIADVVRDLHNGGGFPGVKWGPW